MIQGLKLGWKLLQSLLPGCFATESKCSKWGQWQRRRRQEGEEPTEADQADRVSCRWCSRSHGLSSDLRIPQLSEPTHSLVFPSSCPSSTEEAPRCGWWLSFVYMEMHDKILFCCLNLCHCAIATTTVLWTWVIDWGSFTMHCTPVTQGASVKYLD